VAITDSLTREDQVLRDNALVVVKDKFLGMATKVGPHIEKLKGDLLKEDEPSLVRGASWNPRRGRVGCWRCGLRRTHRCHYAAKLLKKAIPGKENIWEAGQEFVKALVEEGTGKGSRPDGRRSKAGATRT